MSSVVNRPKFPKRAVITGGMPYGNKELHFGHIGGVFIHADIFARFLRDRIGKDNVIFVSGTDCYGATIEASYDNAVKNGFKGSIEDFVKYNHDKQLETLNNYEVSLDLFATSALGESGKIHADLSQKVFNTLYDKEQLKIEETLQFYDEEKQVFLNGRQVTGRCPIQGCKSEVAYADECSLGHQYNPSELINPVSTLSNKKPSYVAVKNWFFDLPKYVDNIEKQISVWEKNSACRKSLIQVVSEFLRKPSVYIKKETTEEASVLLKDIKFNVVNEENKTSNAFEFDTLEDRDRAVNIFDTNGIRYRKGKTVVPFRLSGNVAWGISVPQKENIKDLTFWVWPESLWAPISFTKTVLGDGKDGKKWEDWWKSDDSQVYQFIGEDNIYFYAIAEMGLFEALGDGLKMPMIIPNRHLLYGKTKASSSGALKPPKAMELLDCYTSEQLRLHFMNAGLADRSVGFEPKAITGNKGEYDPTLYEGNLLTNIFNRLVRSCFYTLQKYCDGVYPQGYNVSSDILKLSEDTIYEYEQLMSQISLNKVFDLLNIYLRDANKEWAAKSKTEDKKELEQLLVDMFHVVKICTTLVHPIAPTGADMIREYLGFDERLWNWDYIFEDVNFFIKGKKDYKFKFLEPRIDFFAKHDSQVKK